MILNAPKDLYRMLIVRREDSDMLLTEMRIRAIVREFLSEAMGHTQGYADPMQEGSSPNVSDSQFLQMIASRINKVAGVKATVGVADTEEDDTAPAIRFTGSDKSKPIVTTRIGKDSVAGVYKSVSEFNKVLTNAVRDVQSELKKMYKDVASEDVPDFVADSVGEFMSTLRMENESPARASEVVLVVAISRG